MTTNRRLKSSNRNGLSELWTIRLVDDKWTLVRLSTNELVFTSREAALKYLHNQTPQQILDLSMFQLERMAATAEKEEAQN